MQMTRSEQTPTWFIDNLVTLSIEIAADIVQADIQSPGSQTETSVNLARQIHVELAGITN